MIFPIRGRARIQIHGCLDPKSLYEFMRAKDRESFAVETRNLDFKEADFPKVRGEIGQMSRSETFK